MERQVPQRVRVREESSLGQRINTRPTSQRECNLRALSRPRSVYPPSLVYQTRPRSRLPRRCFGASLRRYACERVLHLASQSSNRCSCHAAQHRRPDVGPPRRCMRTRHPCSGSVARRGGETPHVPSRRPQTATRSVEGTNGVYVHTYVCKERLPHDALDDRLYEGHRQ